MGYIWIRWDRRDLVGFNGLYFDIMGYNEILLDRMGFKWKGWERIL